MNRRQYSNQDQGFRRQRNFERSKFYPQNNNFQRYNNQNSNNNNRYNRRRNNNIIENVNNRNNRGNNGVFRRRRQINNQNQFTNRQFLSLGNRRRRNNNNNQNNQVNNGPIRIRPRNSNQNQNRNGNMNNKAPLKRQINRQERRFLNEKQKRKTEGLLYISNLSEETVNTDLKDVFESYGRLKRCAVFFDLTTNQSKCRGVVQFTNNVNAQKAKNDLNGTYI